MIKDTGQVLYKHLNFSADGKFMAYSAISTASNIWSVALFTHSAEAIGPPEPLTRDTNIRKSSPAVFAGGKKIIYNVVQIGSGANLADGLRRQKCQAFSRLPNNGSPGWFPGGERLAVSFVQEGP